MKKSKESELSPIHERAVDLLLSGRSGRETAEELGVRQETVSTWRNHFPAFQAELRRRREELREASRMRLESSASKALAVLEGELDSDEARYRIRSAEILLKGAKVVPTEEPAVETMSDNEVRAELQRLNAELLSNTSTANLTDEEREIFFRVVGAEDPMGEAG